MRVGFFFADKARERLLAEAFCVGVKVHGDDVIARPLEQALGCEDIDVAAMIGVKARGLFHHFRRQGAHVVSIDKGYCRATHFRVAVDAHHPTDYVAKAKHGFDRWKALDLRAEPWREKGEHVVFAGSSAKYHAFCELPDPTEFAAKLVRRIARATGRRVIYRPKPSWKEAVPVEHATFSKHPRRLTDEFVDAHCLVTHGSNACFDAMLAGIPSIVLGDGVVRPISSTSLDDIEAPRLATDAERRQLLSNLAYCQFTPAEFASGEAWSVLRPQIFGSI